MMASLNVSHVGFHTIKAQVFTQLATRQNHFFLVNTELQDYRMSVSRSHSAPALVRFNSE